MSFLHSTRVKIGYGSVCFSRITTTARRAIVSYGVLVGIFASGNRTSRSPDGTLSCIRDGEKLSSVDARFSK